MKVLKKLEVLNIFEFLGRSFLLIFLTKMYSATGISLGYSLPLKMTIAIFMGVWLLLPALKIFKQ